ncbi:hypothetical protein KM043_002262 [Ampulex compressa]|nr:hypothetical protein KM043_002262 [Ampulex compressa]
MSRANSPFSCIQSFRFESPASAREGARRAFEFCIDDLAFIRRRIKRIPGGATAIKAARVFLAHCPRPASEIPAVVFSAFSKGLRVILVAALERKCTPGTRGLRMAGLKRKRSRTIEMVSSKEERCDRM